MTNQIETNLFEELSDPDLMANQVETDLFEELSDSDLMGVTGGVSVTVSGNSIPLPRVNISEGSINGLTANIAV